MRLYLLCTVALLQLLSLCSAKQLMITSPTSTTTWVNGQKTTITWTYSGTGVDKFNIDLIAGPTVDESVLFRVIASGVNPNLLQIDYNVPSDLPAGTNYYVRFSAYDASGAVVEYDYSNTFSVSASDPPASTTTAPPTSTSSATPTTTSSSRSSTSTPITTATTSSSTSSTTSTTSIATDIVKGDAASVTPFQGILILVNAIMLSVLFLA